MQETLQKMKLIVFELKGEEYAIPVQQVRSIEKLMPITRVPIVDLRSRFNLAITSPSESSRIIITVVEDLEVGFIVDAANDVVDITEDTIEPAPDVVGYVENKYIKGVVNIDKRLFVCLDLDEVLQLEQLKG
jgi:purine-binding chemotaxis protein CheW